MECLKKVCNQYVQFSDCQMKKSQEAGAQEEK